MSQAGRYIAGTGAAPIETLTGNVGGPVGPDGAGNIDVLGGNNITTTGNSSPNTLTIDVTGTTNHAVQIGNATGSLTSIPVGTNGQVLIGATGADPAFATLTSPGNTIVFTPGPNSLNLETGATIADEYDTDSGTAVPAAGVLEILGGTGIDTSGAGNTVTVTLETPVIVANGGTGNTTFTAYSVICAGTAATNPFQNVSGVGNAGEVLTSNGAATLPTWQPNAAFFFSWNEETGTSANMAVNNGYIANNAGLVTLTLPAVAVVGDVVRVTGKGAGGWSIAQNGGQTIYFGMSATTTGGAGSLSSTDDRDSVELVCVTANDDWNVLSVIGNLTVV